MNVEILRPAKRDLFDGYWFYERQSPGLGGYFLQHLQADIDSLENHAGIHRRVYGRYHWHGSKRFPHAILYFVTDGTAYVDAVIDCRRSAEWIKQRLSL